MSISNIITLFNILYVDDEPSNLNSFKLLYRRKFNIFTAQSAIEGLEILENNPIHLVITDQRMPGMSGVEFLKKVKEKWPDSKYILLTGFTDNEAIKVAINEVGIFWYVNKPFDPEEMSYLMQNALDAYESEMGKRISEEKLRKILDTSIDAIINTNEEQEITMVNSAVTKIFGYQEEELIGEKIKILFPDNTKNHEYIIKDFERSEETIRYVDSEKMTHGKTKTGELIPIEAIISKMLLGKDRYYTATIRDISKRLKAEKNLSNSESKFKGVFNSLMDIYMIIDFEGKCSLVSPSVKQILGYSQEEFMRHPVMDFCQNPEAGDQITQEIFEKGYVRNFIVNVKRKDNIVISVSINSHIIVDDQGNPLEVQTIVRDLTDIVDAQEIIENQRERIALAVDAAKLGIWDWEVKNDILVWEDFMYELYDLEKSDFAGAYQAWSAALHPEDKRNAELEVEAALQGGNKLDMEFRVIWTDQSVRHIRGVASIIRDKYGIATRMVGVNWDITYLRKSDAKLKENAVLLSEVESLANLGLWQWDIISNQVEWSDELYRIYGLQRAEFQSSFEGYLERVHPDDRENNRLQISRSLEDLSSAKFEERIIRPNGEVRALKSWTTVITDSNNKPIKMKGVCLDITDMKIAEQKILQMNIELEEKVQKRTSELEKANIELKNVEQDIKAALIKEKELGELKSRFVSTASHQFRTPLTVIHSNTELMEYSASSLDAKTKKLFEKCFDRIKKETKRMTNMMNDVLILGKIDNGVNTVRKGLIDIVEISKYLVEGLNEVEIMMAKIHLEIINKPRKIFLDKDQFIHILSNILGNAQKYSLDRGDVEFQINFSDTQVELSIKDKGIGMSEEDQESLFQPFFRGQNTEGIQGTGLGLSIAGEYTQENGGEIRVKSKMEVGTTVTLHFNQ
jgi:PAS domain S-box-containing protein